MCTRSATEKIFRRNRQRTCTPSPSPYSRWGVCWAVSVVEWWPTNSAGKGRKTRWFSFISVGNWIVCCRKGGLLLNNILGVTGACLMWCTKVANSYEILFFGRFIIGVNCGELNFAFDGRGKCRGFSCIALSKSVYLNHLAKVSLKAAFIYVGTVKVIGRWREFLIGKSEISLNFFFFFLFHFMFFTFYSPL